MAEDEVKRAAIEAYQAWEDEKIILIPKSEWFRVEWRKTLEDGTELRRYVTPTGDLRVMSAREREQRERLGKPGYYLLSKELEAEGIELLAQFPDAPSLETACTACGQALFSSAGQLKGHLRDVLEGIVSNKLMVGEVSFRKRHRLCYQFTRDVLEPFIEERDQIRSTLRMQSASREDETGAIKRLAESSMEEGQLWLANRRVSPEQTAALLGKITAT